MTSGLPRRRRCADTVHIGGRPRSAACDDRGEGKELGVARAAPAVQQATADLVQPWHGMAWHAIHGMARKAATNSTQQPCRQQPAVRQTRVCDGTALQMILARVGRTLTRTRACSRALRRSLTACNAARLRRSTATSRRRKSRRCCTHRTVPRRTASCTAGHAYKRRARTAALRTVELSTRCPEHWHAWRTPHPESA